MGSAEDGFVVRISNPQWTRDEAKETSEDVTTKLPRFRFLEQTHCARCWRPLLFLTGPETSSRRDWPGIHRNRANPAQHWLKDGPQR